MKKYKYLLVALLVAAVMVWGADETTMIENTDNLSQTPADIDLITLYDNSEDASDTMATTTMKVLGPYSLTKITGEPMYKAFTVRHLAITGTTPTVDLAYQITNRRALNDTLTGGYNSIDTIDATGGSIRVDLSSLEGNYIYFRIDNYDGSTSIMSNWVTVAFKKNLGYYHTKRE